MIELLEKLEKYAEVNNAMRRSLVNDFPNVKIFIVEYVYNEMWKNLRLVNGSCVEEARVRGLEGFVEKYVQRVESTYECAYRALEYWKGN